jgi:hypothetical protein
MNETEARETLCKTLQVSEVIIEKDGYGGTNYIEAILRVIRIHYPKTYLSNDKIAAIKKLRELVTGLGLAEAKAAVERPEDAINFYLKYGKPMGLS